MPGCSAYEVFDHDAPPGKTMTVYLARDSAKRILTTIILHQKPYRGFCISGAKVYRRLRSGKLREVQDDMVDDDLESLAMKLAESELFKKCGLKIVRPNITGFAEQYFQNSLTVHSLRKGAKSPILLELTIAAQAQDVIEFSYEEFLG